MVRAGACPKAGAQEQDGRVKNGITFDTGALIALERRGQRARKVLERAIEQKVRITVPAAVITEWWRSRNDIRERILAAVRVEPLSESIAKVAGEALAAVKGATPIDAIVMASAAQRGDVVYTADISDLAKLAGYFRAVRVLAIG
jgi:predicted nucleic acid-binding protein